MYSRNMFSPLGLESETSAHTYYLEISWHLHYGYPWWKGSQDDVMNVVTWLYLQLLTICATF